MPSMPHLTFGRTGHHSSRILFGAAALGSMGQDTADATLAAAVAAGINHIDTAASYGDSEIRLAPFLTDHRHEVFLATKTGDRTADEARASLERSLERMGVDQVDLIQLHNLVDEDEWETAFGSGGALEALVAARDEGLCRFIGVTGHGTGVCRMHLRSLDRFPFDSVLFPYNYSMLTIDRYRAEVQELIERCRSDGVAMQTIKSLARRRWPGEVEGRFSWYEPLTDPEAIDRAVRFVLAVPDLFLNTTSDARLHPHLFDAVQHFADNPEPPTSAELEADTAAYAITPLFDGGELEVI